MGSNALRAACWASFFVGQRLGVLLTEGSEAREELLRVGLVERGGLAQFGHGIGERLLLLGVEVGVLRRGLGERIEAPAQVGERGLEGRERRRDGCALGADAAEVVLHQPEEALAAGRDRARRSPRGSASARARSRRSCA